MIKKVLLIGICNTCLLISSLAEENFSNTTLVVSLFKGLNFLMNDARPKPDRDALMLLNFLQQQYKVGIPYPTTSPVINSMSANSSNVQYLSKWFNDSFIVEKSVYLDHLHSGDSDMVKSLYCNSYGLPKKYLEEIDRRSKAGGYELTHACLYLQWSINNGCLDENKKDVQKLKFNLKERLDSLVSKQQGTMYDMDIEAVAIYSFLHFPLKNKNQWIGKLLGSQQINGGWRSFESEKNSYAHSTALAVWILIDYLNSIPGNENAAISKLDDKKQFSALYLMSLTNNGKKSYRNLEDLISVKRTDTSYFTGLFIPFKKLMDTYGAAYSSSDSLPPLKLLITDDYAFAFFIYCRFNVPISEQLTSYFQKMEQETDKYKTSILTQRLRVLAIKKMLDKQPVKDLDKIINYTSNQDLFTDILHDYIILDDFSSLK